MEALGFIDSDEGIAALPRRRHPPRLAVRDGGSHVRGITKLAKPKIKIIHVFEPEIMMTDAANFRDLVQRFTGKPPQPPPPNPAIAGRGTKKKTLSRMISGGGRSPPPRPEIEIKEEEVLRREFEEERVMVMANDSRGGGFLGEFEGIDFFLGEPSDSINCMPSP